MDDISDSEIDSTETISRLNFNVMDASTPTYYASDSIALVGPSEVSLFFSSGIVEKIDGTDMIKPNARVVLTHANFMSLVRYWSTRYQFLEEVFGAQPLTINDIQGQDKARVEAAFSKYILGNQSENDNESSNETSE